MPPLSVSSPYVLAPMIRCSVRISGSKPTLAPLQRLDPVWLLISDINEEIIEPIISQRCAVKRAPRLQQPPANIGDQAVGGWSQVSSSPFDESRGGSEPFGDHRKLWKVRQARPDVRCLLERFS